MPVGDRVGCRGVHGAAHDRRLHDPAHDLDPVQPVDPRHVLTARSEPTAGEEPERPHHLRQRASRSLEDDARPEQDDARSGTLGLARFLLPVGAQLRQEITAGWVALGERPVVGWPVVPDGAAADEHGWWRCRGADSCRQTARRQNAAVPESRLRRRRPPLRRERFARQVDHPVGAFECSGPRSRSTVGLPAHLRDAGDARAWIVPSRSRLERARQHTDIVPVFRVHLGQRAAEKPRAAGDDDLHDHDLAEPCRSLQNAAEACTTVHHTAAWGRTPRTSECLTSERPREFAL